MTVHEKTPWLHRALDLVAEDLRTNHDIWPEQAPSLFELIEEKLKESYKNGAQAERRKSSPKSDAPPEKKA